MKAEHAPAFDVRLQEAMAAYGRSPPSEFAMRAWWAALAPYDWPVIEAALIQHVAECKFPPTPADLIERLGAADGRPGPEEAWSQALQAADEQETVVWTQEIAEAFATAKPVLDVGDEVGARKAFLEVYERLITKARRALRPAEWTVSLGHDPQRRLDVLRDAERRGRLPSPLVARLLPPDAQRASGDAAGPADAAQLLVGNVAQFPVSDERDRKRYLAAVREGLRRGAAEKAARYQSIEDRRRAQLDAAAAKRAAQRAAIDRYQLEHAKALPIPAAPSKNSDSD